jgi:hypothetical protein
VTVLLLEPYLEQDRFSPQVRTENMLFLQIGENQKKGAIFFLCDRILLVNWPNYFTRARILKHFMGAEKTTFRLKRYLSNHTCIFGVLKHTSCLSRRVTSTAVFSLEAKEKVSWPQWQTAVYEKSGCLRIPFEKLTFPKAIFLAVTLKCLRIRAQELATLTYVSVILGRVSLVESARCKLLMNTESFCPEIRDHLIVIRSSL